MKAILRVFVSTIIIQALVFGSAITFATVAPPLQTNAMTITEVDSDSNFKFNLNVLENNKIIYDIYVDSDIINSNSEKLFISKFNGNTQTILGAFSFDPPNTFSTLGELDDLEKIELIQALVLEDNTIKIFVKRSSENIVGIDIFEVNGDKITKKQIYRDIITNEVL